MLRVTPDTVLPNKITLNIPIAWENISRAVFFFFLNTTERIFLLRLILLCTSFPDIINMYYEPANHKQRVDFPYVSHNYTNQVLLYSYVPKIKEKGKLSFLFKSQDFLLNDKRITPLYLFWTQSFKRFFFQLAVELPQLLDPAWAVTDVRTRTRIIGISRTLLRFFVAVRWS